MGKFDTPEQREAVRRGYLVDIADMVRSLTEHVAGEPGCNAAPLCIGPSAMEALALATIVDSGYPALGLVVAVGEIARLREELGDARAKMMGMDADLLDANGRAAYLTDELAKAQAELTVWEDAADALGPIGEPS